MKWLTAEGPPRVGVQRPVGDAPRPVTRHDNRAGVNGNVTTWAR
jgi:hypothetical protein